MERPTNDAEGVDVGETIEPHWIPVTDHAESMMMEHAMLRMMAWMGYRNR